MITIRARNTNQMQLAAYSAIQQVGVEGNSRNGPVLMFQEPVCFTYTHPLERVNFCPFRDANPFFHLMEAVAMLANHNNVKFLSRFAKNIANYSDDGKTFNAFYGTRIRSQWGDQLRAVVDVLMNDPNTRQAVISLWDPADLTKKTKDKACNMMMVFNVRNRKTLDCTVFNRSNDLVWGGVTGANVVHFSYFYEYVLCGTGYGHGEMNVISTNAHVYLNDQWERVRNAPGVDRYEGLPDRHSLFGGTAIGFDSACSQFVQDASRTYELLGRNYEYSFIRDLCVPAYNAWQLYKFKNNQVAMNILEGIKNHEDWKLAMQSWIYRRSQDAA